MPPVNVARLQIHRIMDTHVLLHSICGAPTSSSTTFRHLALLLLLGDRVTPLQAVRCPLFTCCQRAYVYIHIYVYIYIYMQPPVKGSVMRVASRPCRASREFVPDNVVTKDMVSRTLQMHLKSGQEKGMRLLPESLLYRKS